MGKQTSKKTPTVLEAACQAEAFAKQAMERAKESFKLAHAAYDAIGVAVAQLETASEQEQGEKNARTRQQN